MPKYLVIALASVALPMLSGCGLKGPLYLPEAKTETVPAQPAQDDEAQEKDRTGRDASATAPPGNR